MEKLFFVGVGQSRDCLELDVETTLVCFIARFLGIPCSKLTFVKQEGARRFFNVAKSSFFKDFNTSTSYHFESHHLPFARDQRLGVNYVGLCTVLRTMVKTKSDFLYLLDENQKCFKACAEVSKWTDLCENKLLKVTMHCMENNNSEEIFEVFSLLETLLSQPPVVSNVNKRRRDAYKQNGKLEVDLLQTHPFMGGLDFLLSDLVICCYLAMILQLNYTFYSVHLDKYPRLFAWFSRILERADVRDAMIDVLGDIPKTIRQSPDIISTEKDIKKVVDCITNGKLVKVSKQVVEEVMKKLPTKDFVPFDNYIAQILDGSKLNFADECLAEIKEILPDKRFARKCEQLRNMIVPVYALASVLPEPCKIVDFCCGSGCLGMALSSLLPRCQVLLVENKEESLARALPVLEKRMKICGLDDKESVDEIRNVEIYQCNLDHFHKEFDIGICLHGCGLVTDLVLQKCFRNKASFVICPCCYGAIHNTESLSYPKSASLQKVLTYDEYSILAHASDQSQSGIGQCDLAKRCMTLVDSDRLLDAQALGYNVWLFTMDPPSCTPKNNLLIGVHKERNINPIFDDVFKLLRINF